MMADLPDVHKWHETRGLPIAKVGIRGYKIPLYLKLRGSIEEPQRVVADVSVYTNLNASSRGTHMSRFARLLTEQSHRRLYAGGFICDMLKALQTRLEADYSYIKLRFDYAIPKIAPVSQEAGLVYYPVVLEGKNTGGEIHAYETVRVQYIATCPCSMELSEDLRKKGEDGTPHQQRAFADVTAEFDPDNLVYIEEIVEAVEGAVKVVPYPVVKREDEQEIARLSKLYPLFSEDAAREIALALDKIDRVLDHVVVCNHEESIHPYVATSVLPRGKDGGLT